MFPLLPVGVKVPLANQRSFAALTFALAAAQFVSSKPLAGMMLSEVSVPEVSAAGAACVSAAVQSSFDFDNFTVRQQCQKVIMCRDSADTTFRLSLARAIR
jgi:hypothetical protein